MVGLLPVQTRERGPPSATAEISTVNVSFCQPTENKLTFESKKGYSNNRITLGLYHFIKEETCNSTSLLNYNSYNLQESRIILHSEVVLERHVPTFFAAS